MARSPRYLARLLSLAGAPLQPSGWAIITVLNREGGQRISQLPRCWTSTNRRSAGS